MLSHSENNIKQKNIYRVNKFWMILQLTTIRKTNPIQEALLKNKKVNIFLLSRYSTEDKDLQYYNG